MRMLRDRHGPPRPDDAVAHGHVGPSVLFDGPHGTGGAVSAARDVFHDLHLDDIVATMMAGGDDYDLARFFAHPVD